MKVDHYPGSAGGMPATRAHRLRAASWLALAVLALAGCGGRDAVRRPASVIPAGTRWPAVAPANPAAANAVLMRALGLVGTPYRYGGNTPESGFDCSGLVAYVYRDVLDLRLPRSSQALSQVQGPPIEPRRLAGGDLVFFGTDAGVSHVGIYVGEGRFVHAPTSGGTVRMDHLEASYWRAHYTGAKRVLHKKSPEL